MQKRSLVWGDGSLFNSGLKIMGAGKITENDPETGKWREGTMSKVWQVKKEIENHK